MGQAGVRVRGEVLVLVVQGVQVDQIDLSIPEVLAVRFHQFHHGNQ